MGGYNGLLGYGGARAGGKEAMTDEEIYNKLRREYPGASTAALYQMLEEVKKSLSATNGASYSYTIPDVSTTPEYEFGFTGFRPAQTSQKYEIDFGEVQRLAGTQQVNNNSYQNSLSNQLNAITYEQLQNAYNQYWSGDIYPTYGTQPRYYTASQAYFPPPPMLPVPQKPVKKQSQAEIAVTGKRSIILDGEDF